MQTQMNLENQIQQRFQTPAAGKHLKPYQGLKRDIALLRDDAQFHRRKTPKTRSGIETELTQLGLSNLLPENT